VIEAARNHRASLQNPAKKIDEYLSELHSQGLTRNSRVTSCAQRCRWYSHYLAWGASSFAAHLDAPKAGSLIAEPNDAR